MLSSFGGGWCPRLKLENNVQSVDDTLCEECQLMLLIRGLLA